MLLLGLIPWSDRKLMPGVEGQLFGGGEASFGYSDLISPRVDSDISDYYYDYQDQVWKFMLKSSIQGCRICGSMVALLPGTFF